MATENGAHDDSGPRSHRLRELHDAALALALPAPPDREAMAALLGRIVSRAQEAVGAHDGALVLTEDEAWAELLPDTSAADGAIWLDFRGRLSRRRLRPEGATSQVLASGRPVTVSDTAAKTEFGRYVALPERGIRSFTIVPLIASDHVLGALSLNFAGPNAMAGVDPELLPLFAAHAAAALERMRLAFAERKVARQAEQLARREAEAAALRELDRLKDELLVTISHELRTPLTVLYGYALRLRARADRLDHETVRQSAEGMLSAAAQLKRLAEDLLDFGHLQRGEVPVHPEEIDVAPVLTGLVEAFRAHAGGERILGSYPVRLMAVVDRARLTQAVGNMLENALLYAPGGPIVLRASRSAVGGGGESAGKVRIEVQDSGPGISTGDQARVWDRFFRGSRVAGFNVARGLGIGLAVVKAIAEAHGGRVGVESEPGRGACFWLEVPAASGNAERTERSGQRGQSGLASAAGLAGSAAG